GPEMRSTGEVLGMLSGKYPREVFRELRTAVARINSFLQERLTGMHVVQMFVTEHYQMNIFKSINRENYLAGMRQVRIFGVFMPIMELLSSAAIALIIWHGGGKVLGESLSLGSLVAFISYMQMFFKPIRDIAEKYNIMQAAMASTERIFEFMDKDEEISPPPNPYFPAEFKGHITFRDVKFSYRKEQNVLSGVSFEIRPGEKVAVVGPTGSGKTTIINLLERFYDPDEGAILLDGVDIRQWDQNELHRRIGFVMQDVFIFSGTVRENISLGLADPSATEESARIANAKNFIDRLPAKMDEVMGEAGATLSAGQRQLLSFARALAKRPGILILDEATSSVDPETERLIQDAIARMTAKRTTLVVAHRLSTIIDSDRIMVIHRGRIAEQGTHEELIRLGGIYQKLHRLQSRS
ncbi:MAG: ABC transporter ATP-binding protein, partial [Desulfobacteraceae bacterium]